MWTSSAGPGVKMQTMRTVQRCRARAQADAVTSTRIAAGRSRSGAGAHRCWCWCRCRCVQVRVLVQVSVLVSVLVSVQVLARCFDGGGGHSKAQQRSVPSRLGWLAGDAAKPLAACRSGITSTPNARPQSPAPPVYAPIAHTTPTAAPPPSLCPRRLRRLSRPLAVQCVCPGSSSPPSLPLSLLAREAQHASRPSERASVPVTARARRSSSDVSRQHHAPRRRPSLLPSWLTAQEAQSPHPCRPMAPPTPTHPSRAP